MTNKYNFYDIKCTNKKNSHAYNDDYNVNKNNYKTYNYLGI